MFLRKKNKIDRDMIPSLRPTSKASLKQICLIAADGDLEKAQALYDYMAKDMEDLPLFDAPQPSTFQQVKSGIGDTMQWINENQNQIFVWLDIMRGFLGNKKNGGGIPPASIPQAPIPPIN